MNRESRAVERLADLTRRRELPEPAADKLGRLVEFVATDPQAPTTVKDPSKILDDHLADSLVALELPEVCAASTISDLGTGAGFPGIPLAIALPDARVFLIESNGRKCAFITRLIEACELENARIVRARAEEWPEGIGGSGVVTARALAPLDVVAEYAAPLLRMGGTLVAWRGRRDPDGEAAAVQAAAELGLEIGEVRPVTPYRGAKHRYLHLMSKVMETPRGFPRRAGMAQKRPLGSRRAPRRGTV